jgi:hypothetical protein
MSQQKVIRIAAIYIVQKGNGVATTSLMINWDIHQYRKYIASIQEKTIMHANRVHDMPSDIQDTVSQENKCTRNTPMSVALL